MSYSSASKRAKITAAAKVANSTEHLYAIDPAFLSSMPPSYLQAGISILKDSRPITPDENTAFGAVPPGESQVILMTTVPLAGANEALGLVNLTSIQDSLITLPQLRTGAKPSRQHVRSGSLRYLQILVMLNAFISGTLQLREKEANEVKAARNRIKKAEKSFQQGARWTDFVRTTYNQVQGKASAYSVLVRESVLDKEQSGTTSVRFWLFIRGPNPKKTLIDAWAQLQEFGAICYTEEVSHIMGLGHTPDSVSASDAAAQAEYKRQNNPQAQQQAAGASIAAAAAVSAANSLGTGDQFNHDQLDRLMDGLDFGQMGDEEAPPPTAPEDIALQAANIIAGNQNDHNNNNNGFGGAVGNGGAGVRAGGNAAGGVSGIDFEHKYGLDWSTVPRDRRRNDEGSIIPTWLKNIMQVVNEQWHIAGIPSSGVKAMIESINSGKVLEYNVPFRLFQSVCPDEAEYVSSMDNEPDYVRITSATGNSVSTHTTRSRYRDDRKPVERLEYTGIVHSQHLEKEWFHLGDYVQGEGKLVAFQPAYLFPAHALSSWNSDATSTRQMFIGNYFYVKGMLNDNFGVTADGEVDTASALDRKIAALAADAKAPLHELLDTYFAAQPEIVKSLGMSLHDLDSVQALILNHAARDSRFGMEPTEIGYNFRGFPDSRLVHVISPSMAVNVAAIPTLYCPPPSSISSDMTRFMEWEDQRFDTKEAIHEAFKKNAYSRFNYLYDLLQWTLRPAMIGDYACKTSRDDEIANHLISTTILYGSCEQVASLMKDAERVFLGDHRARDLFDVATLAQLKAARCMMRTLAAMSIPMYSFWQSCSNSESLNVSYGEYILQASSISAGTAGQIKFETRINEQTGAPEVVKWPGFFDTQDPAVVGDDLGYSDWAKLFQQAEETTEKQRQHLHKSHDQNLAILEPSSFLRRVRTKAAVMPYRMPHAKKSLVKEHIRWHQTRLYDRLWKPRPGLAARQQPGGPRPPAGGVPGSVSAAAAVVGNAPNPSQPILVQDPETGAMISLQGEEAQEFTRMRQIEDAINAFGTDTGVGRNLDNERFNHRGSHGSSDSSSGSGDSGGGGRGGRMPFPTRAPAAGTGASTVPEYDPITMGDMGSAFSNKDWFQAGALRSRARDNIDAFRASTHFPEFVGLYSDNVKKFVQNLLDALEDYSIAVSLPANLKERPEYAQINFLAERFRLSSIRAIGLVKTTCHLINQCNIRPLLVWPSSHPNVPSLARVFASILKHWKTTYGKTTFASKFPYKDMFTKWGKLDNMHACFDRLITESIMNLGIGESGTAHMVAFVKILFACVCTSLVLDKRDDNVVALSVICTGGTGEGKSHGATTALKLITPDTHEPISSHTAMSRNTEDNADGAVEFMDEGAVAVTGGNSKHLDEAQIADWKAEQSLGYLVRERAIKDEATGIFLKEKTISSRRVCKVLCQNKTSPNDAALAARFLLLVAKQLFTGKNQAIWDSITGHVTQSSSMNQDTKRQSESKTVNPIRMIHALKGIIEMLIYAGILSVEYEHTVNYANSLMEILKPKFNDPGKSRTRQSNNMGRLIRSEVTTIAAMNLIVAWNIHHDVNGFSASATDIPLDFIIREAPRFLYADSSIAAKCATMLFYSDVDNEQHANLLKGMIGMMRNDLSQRHVKFLVEKYKRPHKLTSEYPLLRNKTRKQQNRSQLASSDGQEDQQQQQRDAYEEERNDEHQAKQEARDWFSDNAPYVTWSDQEVAWEEKDREAAQGGARAAIAGAMGTDEIAVLNCNYVVIEQGQECTTEKQFCLQLEKHLPADGKYNSEHIAPIMRDMAKIEVEIGPEQDYNRKIAEVYNAEIAARAHKMGERLPSMSGYDDFSSGHHLDRRKDFALSSGRVSDPPSPFTGENYDSDAMTHEDRVTSPQRLALNPGGGIASNDTTSVFDTSDKFAKPVGRSTSAATVAKLLKTKGKQAVSLAGQKSLLSYGEKLPKNADTFSNIESGFSSTGLPNDTQRMQEEEQAKALLPSTFHTAEYQGSATLEQAAAQKYPLLHLNASEVHKVPLIRVYRGEYKKQPHRVVVLYQALYDIYCILTGQALDGDYSTAYDRVQRPYKGTMISLLEQRLRETQKEVPYPSFVPKEIYTRDSHEITQYIPTSVMASANPQYVFRFAHAVVDRALELHAFTSAPRLHPAVVEFMKRLPNKLLVSDFTMNVSDVIVARYKNSDEWRYTINKTLMPKFHEDISAQRRLLSGKNVPLIENIDGLVNSPSDRIVSFFVEHRKRLNKIQQGLRMYPYGADFESYAAHCAESYPPSDPCQPANYMTLALCYKKGLESYVESIGVLDKWKSSITNAIEAEHASDPVLAKVIKSLDDLFPMIPVSAASQDYPQCDLDFQLKSRFNIQLYQQFSDVGPRLSELEPANFPRLSPAAWLVRSCVILSHWLNEMK